MARQQTSRPLEATAQLKVYVKERIRREVEAEARAQGASMNAIINYHLERAYGDRGKVRLPLATRLFEMLEAAAKLNRREVEAEIMERVRQSFDTTRLSFVPNERLRAEIETAAAFNKRSVNEELGARIEHSFTAQLATFDEPVPSHLHAAANAFVALLKSLELFTGRTFGEDPWLHQQAASAIDAWFQLHQPPGEINPSGDIRSRDWRNDDIKPLPREFIEAFGAWLAAKESVEPRWYSLHEWHATLARFEPIPADPRLPMPPGTGSALRRKAAEQSYAQQLQQARQRAVEKLLAELAGEWRFVVKPGSKQKGSWHRRDGEVWAKDPTASLVFYKARLACRAVSNAIIEEGSSAALARAVSSYKTIASVERLARTSHAGDISGASVAVVTSPTVKSKQTRSQ
jgi:hypothetical protein